MRDTKLWAELSLRQRFLFVANHSPLGYAGNESPVVKGHWHEIHGSAFHPPLRSRPPDREPFQFQRSPIPVRKLLSLSLLCVSVLTAQGAGTAKPNFVVINIDDLGYSDIGPFG